MIPILNLFESVDYQIYCDLDGVLTDFEKMADEMGVPATDKRTKKELWRQIFRDPTTFWSKMDWTNDGKSLWNFIKSLNPILLSSVPAGILNKGKTGKQRWVTKELGDIPLIVVPSNSKSKYANKNSILIDDTEKNINAWERSSGVGILHENSADTIELLKKILGG